MSYQVLARSWRPKRFADLIGQEAVVRTIQNAIAADRLGQAYLFSGLRGVGKTTAARLLAKAVNCENGPTPEPCGECLSCREITEGISLDVVELDAATRTGVDEIRELQEVIRYRPTRDRYRVIIVDEVHMLSISAFNALLKSIEEPPPYLLWIFATTERHKVPATVLSRCQELEFRPVPVARIEEHLSMIAEKEGFTLDPEAARMIARAAGGSVRDALSLTDQLRAFSGDAIGPDAVAEVLGVPRKERVLNLVGSILDGDAGALLEGLREELREGHDPAVLYEELGRSLRTLTLLAVESDPAPDVPQETTALAGRLDVDGWTRLLGLWLDLEPAIRSAAHRELALEIAALRLSRWPSVRRIESLLGEGGDSSGSGGTGRKRNRPASRPAPRRSASRQETPSEVAPSTPTEALADALWSEGLRQAAGAVRAAEVELGKDRVTVRFSADRIALGRMLEDHSERLRALAATLWKVSGIEIVVDDADADTPGGLRAEVLNDPQVRTALEVLGGTIETVRPETESNGEWT